jgi:hypothetical protein
MTWRFEKHTNFTFIYGGIIQIIVFYLVTSYTVVWCDYTTDTGDSAVSILRIVEPLIRIRRQLSPLETPKNYGVIQRNT